MESTTRHHNNGADLYSHVMRSLSPRVMQYPIPFPTFTSFLDVHEAELLQLRLDLVHKDAEIFSAAQQVTDALVDMSEYIINYDGTEANKYATENKSLVIQKTTREVPDGITITRRSRPSVDSINPEVDESTALFNRVMDKINIRVLQYPIMFPSIQLMIDRHPELWQLRSRHEQLRSRHRETSNIPCELELTAGAVAEIVKEMFACITDFDTPHEYYTPFDDGSIWHKIGPIVPELLRSKLGSKDSPMRNVPLERALLLCEPAHVLASIGYDITKPDGGIDDRVLEPVPRRDPDSGYFVDGHYKSTIFDFSKHYVETDSERPDNPKHVPLLARVLLEYNEHPFGGLSSSTIGPSTVLEPDDMFERRLRHEFDQHSSNQPRRPIGFSIRSNIAPSKP